MVYNRDRWEDGSMITISVCIQCKAKGCCDYKDGIELYEFFKDYITEYLEDEVEINLNTCNCMKICKGPVVKVQNRVYTNVDKRKALEIIKDLTVNKGREEKWHKKL